MVAEELLQRNVLHLPAVHDFLCNHADKLAVAANLGEKGDIHKLVTCMWVLSILRANLQHHITYRCTVCKYGTLIFRPNTDLIPSLQKTMWRLRQLESTSKASETRIKSQHLDDLNQRVHGNIQTLLSRKHVSPFEHDMLNIDKFIEEADPQLWNTICLLTRSVSERRGTSKATLDETSIAFQTKKTRRFFLLCALLFCTDDCCSLPLHTLVTDMVDSQGGSALLIRILNRLGVCASFDTLKWFIQHKVSTAKVAKSLNLTSFTVVSADNIDFLHSYACVFQGRQNGSWHGASIQAAQPLPSLSLVETEVDMEELSLPSRGLNMEISTSTVNRPLALSKETSMAKQPSVTKSCKRSNRSSPIQSPLKLTRSPAPKARKMRTGTESNSQSAHL